MSRITEQFSACDSLSNCDKWKSDSCGDCRIMEVIKALKAYEDTGLTPEHIKRLKQKTRTIDKFDCDSYYEFYNKTCTNLPKVLTNRINHHRERATFEIHRLYGFEDFKTVCEKANKSDYLTGKITNWRADYDWIIQPKNFIGILEGIRDNVKNHKNFENNSFEISAVENLFNNI